MFIGHFAAGFAAKRIAPEVSLGTLFLAAQFIDLIWPTFLLLGWESVRIEPGATASVPLVFEHYPWSHSLAAVMGWALLLALLHYTLKRRLGSAVVIGALVVSHWLLDALVHVPDLPLAPSAGVQLGLGLWNAPIAALTLEFVLLAGGVFLYVRSTLPSNRRGTIGLVTLVILLALIQLANAFGEPPPSTAAIAWVGQAQWLLVAWAYWLERHRRPRGDLPGAPRRIAAMD